MRNEEPDKKMQADPQFRVTWTAGNQSTHTHALTAVLTFCTGLIILHALVWALNLKVNHAGMPLRGMVYFPEVLVVPATILFLIVRRERGDFHALFIICFVLFIFSECIDALVRRYGIFDMSGLSSLFSVGMLFYSMMATSAAMADPQQTRERRVLTVATVGFTFLGGVRLFLEMTGRGTMRHRNLVALVVLAVIVLAEIAVLLAAKRHEVPKGEHDAMLTPETFE